MALYYAVKHLELFGSVTPYAGTYDYLYHKEYRTVGVAPEKAIELYEDMMREEWHWEENNILCLIRQNVKKFEASYLVKLFAITLSVKRKVIIRNGIFA